MKAKLGEINSSSLGRRQKCGSCSSALPGSAPAMAPRLLLSLLLLAAAPLIAWAQGIGSSPSDCCLKYSKRRIPDSVVKSYSLQGSESGCMNPAVVIITKKDKKICFPPKRSDIQAIMQKLDKRGQDKKDKKKEPLQLPRSRSKRQKRQQVF